LRTGITLAVGGEFGIALLTLLLQNKAIDPAIAQPMLVAVVVAMVLGPVILANNKRLARLLLGERGPAEDRDRTRGRGHLGRGQARARDPVRLRPRRPERGARARGQGFEYIAIDLDPVRVRTARQIGQPVVYGDSADEQVLEECGLATPTPW
jgi:CPA2 family monovalent cation:H+ antiporter-2